MKLPRAILFDNDGVLVTSEPLHWKAWARLLEELQIPCPEEDLRRLVGRTAPQILAGLLDAHRPGWTTDEYDLERLALRKNDFYLRSVQSDPLPTYPGVLELLRWLRSEGVRIAVVSNAKSRELHANLRSAGIEELIELKLSREDIPAPKPDPSGYLQAAAELGVSAEEALVVEDSPPGISAGLLGGIPSAAVLTNFTRGALESPIPGRPDLRPVYIAESMQDLRVWLGQLSR
jgi:beta-phosphoglucomutase